MIGRGEEETGITTIGMMKSKDLMSDGIIVLITIVIIIVITAIPIIAGREI